MAYIINIDTAMPGASVAICKNGQLCAIKHCDNQNHHAAFVQPAIKELMSENKFKFCDINAVAVTAGPGSYTGLRVAMASAKGLCYALKIPLIAIGTLKVMAKAARNFLIKNNLPLNSDTLFCPMIDARRLEVFTALYSHDLMEVEASCAKILTNEYLTQLVNNQHISIFGNGSDKIPHIQQNKYNIINVSHNATHLGALSYQYYIDEAFSNIAYTEPLYSKEFFTNAKRF